MSPDLRRDHLLRAGALTIELGACQARLDGQLLELTAKEFDLLAYLVARPGRVFDRDQLLHEVWQSAAEWQQPATVTEHIRRLRAKIETEPRRPRILRTVRGTGYRLDIPEAARDDTNSVTPLDVRDLSTRLGGLVAAVLGDVTDAVIILDLRFHVRSWNASAERLYGWRQHDVLGRPVLDVLQWIGDDDDPADIWDALVRTSHWAGTGPQVARDGSTIDVVASTRLLRDDSGEPVAIVLVNRASQLGSAARGAIQKV